MRKIVFLSSYSNAEKTNIFLIILLVLVVILWENLLLLNFGFLKAWYAYETNMLLGYFSIYEGLFDKSSFQSFVSCTNMVKIG